MGSSLPTEKLDRSNYASWSYKMHQHLLEHGYWSSVDGANDTSLDATHWDPSAWEQAASRVMYCFACTVSDRLLSHIRDAKTPKEAWTNLKKVLTPSNARQKDMSVANYTTHIKEICDSLASINVTIEEDDMVQV